MQGNPRPKTISLITQDKRTPLHAAAEASREMVASELLPPSRPGAELPSPSELVCKLLLDAGAAKDAKDSVRANATMCVYCR